MNRLQFPGSRHVHMSQIYTENVFISDFFLLNCFRILRRLQV